jgi:hypothetical protein
LRCQEIQNKSNICVIYPAQSIPFPAIANRCNPRRYLDITFHHITSQLSALVSALALALLAVSLAGIARRSRSVDSHNVQQLQQAQVAQVAKPQGGQSHPITVEREM